MIRFNFLIPAPLLATLAMLIFFYEVFGIAGVVTISCLTALCVTAAP